MIDYFALALTHALLVIAFLRIAGRSDLDREAPMGAAEADEPDSPATRRARRSRPKQGAPDA